MTTSTKRLLVLQSMTTLRTRFTTPSRAVSTDRRPPERGSIVVRRTAEEVAKAKAAARADKKTIIKLYVERQHSMHQIADAYDIHHTWLKKWFNEWGVPTGSQRSVQAPV
ncbi:hypothetical protein ACFTZI_20870 [Streptomyces decoyicus]|uniref:hypothetical protein n=1 Tax=Streptomyces decoyicus TaxID=249567 RepID=UPI0036302ED0